MGYGENMTAGAYRIEIRQRDIGSPAFRWEIYRGAEIKCVARSFNLFRSAQLAQQAGERALVRLQAERKLDADTG